MLSEAQIQLKAQQYLQRFEHSHQQKKNLLKQVEFKVNFAAKKIQKAWRNYLFKKRNFYAIKIQSAWKTYKKKIDVERQKIKKFREVFYRGKIAWFILKKYFKQKPSNQSKNIEIPRKKQPFVTNLSKYFPSYINLSETYAAQCSYIQKLRLYQKQKFSKSWQKYQETLKKQLQKQATKKWVKKNQSIWITQQSKEINLEQYIERQVQKIFQREYNKYKQADLKLQSTVAVLREKMKQFSVHYYRKMLDQSQNKFK